MRVLLHITSLLLLFATLAAAQQPTALRVLSGEEVEREALREKQVGNLYKRAAASQFVVIGTVSEIRPVAERGHPPSIDDHRSTLQTERGAFKGEWPG
jgi:hypothetical protein